MIDKNLLEQIKQRTDKLIEEQDKLQHMELRGILKIRMERMLS